MRDEAGLIAVMLVSAVIGVVGIAFYLWYAIALAILFPRIGGRAWKGWVPLVNESEILARGGQPAWAVVFYLIPFVAIYGLYLKVVAVHRIGRMFGRGAGTTVLAILLPPVWASVLAGGPPPDPEHGRLEAMVGATVAGAAGGAAGSGPGLATGPLAAAVPAVPVAPATPAPVSAPPAPVSAPPAPVPPVAPAPAHPWAGPAAPDPEPHGGVVVPPPPRHIESIAIEPVPAAVPVISPPPVVTRPRPQVEEPAPPRPPLAVFAEPMDDTPAAETIISAPRPEPEEDELDSTVVVDRRPRVPWHLVLDDGSSLTLTEDSVVLGRKPVSDAFGVQVLAVPDRTRTLSKTHARIDLDGDRWMIVDLGSTNGVLIVDDAGTETLIEPGTPTPLHDRFILGTLGMRIMLELEIAP